MTKATFKVKYFAVMFVYRKNYIMLRKSGGLGGNPFV